MSFLAFVNGLRRNCNSRPPSSPPPPPPPPPPPAAPKITTTKNLSIYTHHTHTHTAHTKQTTKTGGAKLPTSLTSWFPFSAAMKPLPSSPGPPPPPPLSASLPPTPTPPLSPAPFTLQLERPLSKILLCVLPGWHACNSPLICVWAFFFFLFLFSFPYI